MASQKALKRASASLYEQVFERPFNPALSAVRGRLDPRIRDVTTSDLLAETARKYPNHRAVISPRQSMELTYNELDQAASSVATNLYDFGYRHGDRIGVCAGNIWEYMVLQLGLGRLGAILVPLNPAFTPKQHLSALERTESKGLIIQSFLPGGSQNPPYDTSPLIEELTSRISGLSIFTINHVVHGQNRTLEGLRGRVFDATDILQETRARAFVTEPSEIIHMQFTSGTTADPKIACLTHRILNNNGILEAEQLGLSATEAIHPSKQDHICVPVPMFHCFGLVLSNLMSVAAGACIVLPSERFEPVATLKAVGEYDCTVLHGVPTMFAAELDKHEHIPKGGFKYLRTGIAAGSSVPPALMERVIHDLGLPELVIGYGMTETGPVTFMTKRDDPFEKRVSTVGRVLPGSECMIVKPGDDTLTPIRIREKGEIVTSGYSLQPMYWQDPKKTAEAMVRDSEGKLWMRTGDEGWLDEEGYLTVSGRIKDMIIRGGENINPQEVENVIYEIDGVCQVAVVGVPDAKYGEQIGAFVVHEHDATLTAEIIRATVKDHIGHYMVPKYIWIVDTLPKTASGKIRKVELRDQSRALVDRNEFL